MYCISQGALTIGHSRQQRPQLRGESSQPLSLLCCTILAGRRGVEGAAVLAAGSIVKVVGDIDIKVGACS